MFTHLHTDTHTTPLIERGCRLVQRRRLWSRVTCHSGSWPCLMRGWILLQQQTQNVARVLFSAHEPKVLPCMWQITLTPHLNSARVTLSFNFYCFPPEYVNGSPTPALRGGCEWLASHSLANKNSLANSNSLQGPSGTRVAQAATLTSFPFKDWMSCEAHPHSWCIQ